MMSKTVTRQGIYYVENKYWGPDDYYLQIPLIGLQVHEEDGFKEGDTVKVTISGKKSN